MSEKQGSPDNSTHRGTIFSRIAEWVNNLTPNPFPKGKGKEEFSPVRVRVDDSTAQGWGSLTGRSHDYDQSVLQELYADALTAWRKNPIAWRIIQITADYVVGDGMHISSPNRVLNKFIQAFWYDAQNRIDLRLEAMCDELSRSGDLFVALFRNPVDGMSYVRFVTKDKIVKIETAENDWETELVYYEQVEGGVQQTREWYSPSHPGASTAGAVMLHYSVNRPVGALLGESDLTTMIPWLQRYSRMLEDRVKLNWAMRAFLWVVTVPANKVREKQEQYRLPPESGSIVIKDESEEWQVQAPTLHAIDASRDLQAVRMMIDAGSGYPAHWRGEAGDANLATATAMQGPAERHLTRRQQYFMYMLQDITYHAYQRKAELGLVRSLPTNDYAKLFVMQSPDVSRQDNEALSRASGGITSAMSTLASSLPGMPAELARRVIRLAFLFAGQPVDDEELDAIVGAYVKGEDVMPDTTDLGIAGEGKEEHERHEINESR